MSNIIDELRVIDGVFLYETFVIREITDYLVYQIYSASELRSMAKSIQENEPFYFNFGKNQRFQLPVEENNRIQYEFNLIANELENYTQQMKVL